MEERAETSLHENPKREELVVVLVRGPICSVHASVHSPWPWKAMFGERRAVWLAWPASPASPRPCRAGWTMQTPGLRFGETSCAPSARWLPKQTSHGAVRKYWDAQGPTTPKPRRSIMVGGDAFISQLRHFDF